MAISNRVPLSHFDDVPMVPVPESRTCQLQPAVLDTRGMRDTDCSLFSGLTGPLQLTRLGVSILSSYRTSYACEYTNCQIISLPRSAWIIKADSTSINSIPNAHRGARWHRILCATMRGGRTAADRIEEYGTLHCAVAVLAGMATTLI